MKLNLRINILMLKKNLAIILIVVLTLLLIVFVIWLFEKRIEGIDIRMR